MKLMIVLVCGLMVAACDQPTPLKNVDSKNVKVSASVIAHVDGKYKVYRLEQSQGQTIYFVVKDDSPIATSYSVDCGDDCVEQTVVQVLDR